MVLNKSLQDKEALDWTEEGIHLQACHYCQLSFLLKMDGVKIHPLYKTDKMQVQLNHCTNYSEICATVITR